ncbi:self-incompatibility protein S1-like [Lotus japonicus]|uniref:self-incompatibility protein S1-like n=1 Tax=Lotus japonicus TaxID=34305 RepID=UPI002582E897|nr:self-incompatibility protein S1-like [Lotus japonicus]
MVVLVLGLLLCTFAVTVAGSKHVSIKNKLGSGKDNDMGKQNIEDGNEFGWDFSDNVFGTTIFFCDLAWERVQQYYIDAYSFGRDLVRCKSGCS